MNRNIPARVKKKRRSVKPEVMAILLLVGAFFSAQSVADGNITFVGGLIDVPDCTINNNRTIDVDFGDNIITRQVDGLNFRVPVAFTLSCVNLPGNGLQLAIRGNGAGFGSGLISTNKPGLAIQLWQEGDKLSNNAMVNFTYPDVPALWATPVAQDNTTLTAGAFSGTASLVLRYQ